MTAVRVYIANPILKQAMEECLAGRGYQLSPNPDVAIIEIDHVELDQTIQVYPSVVMVPKDYNRQLIFRCVHYKVPAYLSDECTLDDLQDAIEKISRGEKFYSPAIVETVFDFTRVMAKGKEIAGRYGAKVTSREMDVLEQIAMGKSNAQISKSLFVSLYTVKNHVHNILEKLSVKNRREAVKVAVDNGWLTPAEFRKTK